MRLLYIVGMATALALSAPVGAQSAAFTAQQRAEGEAQIRTAAADLATNMRDPSSATFRNVFIQKRVMPDGREPLTICGEVNARNAFGGLTGFQMFTLVGDTVYVGQAVGFAVAELCRNNNPVIDTRDYAPEMRAAYAAALRR